MTIRVPNTLTADNSEKYNVSIRLWPGGLSFSGYEPLEKDSFFIDTVSFDETLPLVQSLKEVFFDNECFSYVYHSFYVIYVSEKYTLVPDSVFSEKDKDLLFSYCYPLDKGMKVLVQPLKRMYSSLLFGVDNETYEFLMRSLVNTQFIHFLSPMLIAWQKKSLTLYPKQMYAVIHDSTLDIVCYEHGEMLFVNSFGFETDNDITYFIMYAWKQLSMNQLEDSLFLCGEVSKCEDIKAVIDTYVSSVECIVPKVEKYTSPLDEKLYMDVVTLTECGL